MFSRIPLVASSHGGGLCGGFSDSQNPDATESESVSPHSPHSAHAACPIPAVRSLGDLLKIHTVRTTMPVKPRRLTSVVRIASIVCVLIATPEERGSLEPERRSPRTSLPRDG